MSSIFGGKSANGSASQPDMQARKAEIMEQVKAELQLANAQELINKMNEKCYQKCVPKPGAMLTKSEETCLLSCMDRYMEACKFSYLAPEHPLDDLTAKQDEINVVSRSYVARLSKERGQLGSAGGGMLGGDPTMSGSNL
ncbi:Mitochondrial import inner membrane translocase, subunit TIM13 [Phaffia rhodozyma]|uniref:Mitochondrial import inner membrane translocase subunit n=1 Tax=Phaffia rhodozyma TaxID=264483 RepID=A0A0F7SKJ5_PHARH|nr:Mitochondrial import inner membrane translocase, subunit TIM13 [Phaffia rhodozyma]